MRPVIQALALGHLFINLVNQRNSFLMAYNTATIEATITIISKGPSIFHSSILGVIPTSRWLSIGTMETLMHLESDRLLFSEFTLADGPAAIPSRERPTTTMP